MNSEQNQIGETLDEPVDRISSLPDDIICDNILSLIPTKDSVRTSALSTRWKHLFASVPVLDFNSCDENFLDVVVKVLNTVKEKGSGISKLKIYLERMCSNLPSLIPSIDYFTSHSIQKLDLRIFYSDYMPIPHSLFTCETLVSLSLGVNFLWSVPDIVCLPKLKELILNNISLREESDDESVRRLFSSCLVLEKLVIHSGPMPNAKVFNVSVPSLKVLSLYLGDPSVKLVIDCPNLEELTYTGYGMSEYCLNVIGVLKKCNIKIYLSNKDAKKGKLIDLVRQVSKVQFLSLCGHSMQALLFPPYLLPNFEILTHLELESSRSTGWRLLPSLLDSSPCLESLVFTIGFCDYFGRSGNPLPPQEHVPVCLSFHLRMVKIGSFHGIEEEYKWVEYFLTNALVLKKMEICLCSSVESKGEGERLLNFQRSSQSCQIILAFSNE